MLDGLLWKTVETKVMWKRDRTLQWLLLEQHRITGATRTAYPEIRDIRAQDYLGFQEADPE